MGSLSEGAAALVARIEATLPKEEDKPPHPRTAATSRAIRDCYYTEDTRAARMLVAVVNCEWKVDDYDRALDSENTKKICLILHCVLVYITPSFSLVLSQRQQYRYLYPDIIGGIELGHASQLATATGPFLRRVHRGFLALLNRSFDKFARQVTALLVTEPLFNEALTKCFARAGYAIVPREAAPLKIAPPEMPPPDVAPKLWADRSPGTKAPHFIRETYAPWIEAGVLTRGALKACDPALYRAYHVWVHRHSEDALTFKETPPPNFIADPSEAIERHRENVKNAMTRYRAKKAMEPSPAA